MLAVVLYAPCGDCVTSARDHDAEASQARTYARHAAADARVGQPKWAFGTFAFWPVALFGRAYGGVGAPAADDGGSFAERWPFGAEPASPRDDPVVAYRVASDAALPDAFKGRSSPLRSVGPEYSFSPAWTLRAGMTIDSAAARSPGVHEPRRWLSAGFGYRPNDHWNIELGYARLFVSDMRLSDFGFAGDTPARKFSSGNLVGVSGRVRF